MRVTLLTTSFPRHPRDGVGSFIYEQAKQLESAGVDITVVAPHSFGSTLVEELDATIRILRFRYFFPVRFQRVAYGSGIVENIKRSWLARLQLPIFFVSFCWTTLRVSKKSNVLHAHWWPSALVALIVYPFIRCPIILTVHGTDVQSIPERGLKRVLVGWVLRHVDHTIAVSSQLQKQIKKISGTTIPITVIPDYIPQLNRFLEVSSDTTNRKNIIWVGRFIPIKNVHILVQAMVEVVHRIPTAHLTLVGDGPLRDNIINAISQQGLQQSITLIGYVTRDRLPELFGQHDIAVLPSRHDGFGVAAAEAMASATAVIVTNTSGIADLIDADRSGVLVKPGDVNQLAGALISLLSDGRRLSDMAEAGRATIRQKLQPHTLTQKLMRVYST